MKEKKHTSAPWRLILIMGRLTTTWVPFTSNLAAWQTRRKNFGKPLMIERIIRTIINGLPKFFLRVCQAAKLLVNGTQVVVSLPIIRINLQGALVCFFSFI